MANKKYDLNYLKEIKKSWKTVCEDSLSYRKKEQYESRKKAVDMYIDGKPLTDISKRTGVPASKVLYYVTKCAESFDENGEAIGYPALLPYKHTKNYKRKKSDISKSNGNSGSFAKLIETYPELETYIFNQYFRKKNETLEKKMNFKTLHRKFLQKCRDLGIQDTQYPFYTTSQGYISLIKFVKKLEEKCEKAALGRYSKDARQRYSSTGYGTNYSVKPLAPFSIVQMDGHKIDALYTVQVENSMGEIVDLPATRMWVIAVIDVATRCILGYSVTQEENYNQTDVLNSLRNSIMPHKPIDIHIRGIEMPENGGFPSTALPYTQWAMFDEIMLDNAKSHLANNVIEKLSKKLKCTINFGSVATPETRGIVERMFQTIEDKGFHRLPSTVGTGISDVRRVDAEKNAVKYQITYEDLCELLEYFIAIYNNSPHSSLDNQTPLECMERRIQGSLLQPYIADEEDRRIVDEITLMTEKRIVRGGYKSGKRPYISYLGVEYRNNDIPLPNGLIGQEITLEINPNDISKIKAYYSDGSELGTLVATGEWGRRPHSLKTRRDAQKYAKQNRAKKTPFYAPLTEYENQLKERAEKQRKARTASDILRNEQGKDTLKEQKENSIQAEIKQFSEEQMKQQQSAKKAKEQHLSDDIMEQIEELGIEEAYKRGLLG